MQTPGRPRPTPPSPNPTHGTIRLSFDLPRSGPARLEVFDLSGRRVGQVMDATLAPGRYVRAWDARDASGRAVASGLYLVRLRASGGEVTRRFVVLH